MRARNALILSGGGARAAYQVGVIKAILEILPKDIGNPFPVLCGTSAGAINAAMLAAHATRFASGLKRLEAIWSSFHTHHIYRSDLMGLASNGGRLMARLIFGMGQANSVTLLDSRPLARMLSRVIPFNRIQAGIDAGCLHALSITASGYTSGDSVSFFQGAPELHYWQRHRRHGAKTTIRLEHVLASSALPMIFPAVHINREYFGDGCMRFLAPISPALHLGAEQIMVIGVDPLRKLPPDRRLAEEPPAFADIAGHIMDSIFIDSLESDLERLLRINKTLSLVPESALREHHIPLRPITTLVITPSEDISRMAGRHLHSMPAVLRRLLGTSADEGSTLLSYLLFEAEFERELIALGRSDAHDRREQILAFFSTEHRQQQA